MNEPIMVFNIYIDKSAISSFNGDCNSVTVIPFTGEVRSELFSGVILPGAVDVQVGDPSGCRNLCARYMFEGVDSDGEKCYLYVENNGWLRNDQSEDAVLHASPRFITDSKALCGYFSQNIFRTEIHPTEEGVNILVYAARSL